MPWWINALIVLWFFMMAAITRKDGFIFAGIGWGIGYLVYLVLNAYVLV